MKAILPTILICLSLVPGLLAGLNKNEPADLKNLTSRYQHDLDDATTPVKERYIDDLKALQQSETSSGNTKAAAAVTRVLQQVEGGSSVVGKWMNDWDGKEIDLFSPNGKWSGDWKGQHSGGTWRAISIDQFIVIRASDHATLYYYLNQDTGSLVRQVGSLEFVRVED